jgi:hypothetical protein
MHFFSRYVQETQETSGFYKFIVDAKGFWRWFVFRITEFMDFFHRPIKKKPKRLKLLRFEIWFWFRPQVKNKGVGVEG